MLQGCAAVVCTVEAERKRAIERTLETAEAVIGLLRVFSIAAYTPWLFCPCAIFGSEYLPKTVALTVVDEPEHAFLSPRGAVTLTPNLGACLPPS